MKHEINKNDITDLMNKINDLCVDIENLQTKEMFEGFRFMIERLQTKLHNHKKILESALEAQNYLDNKNKELNNGK